MEKRKIFMTNIETDIFLQINTEYILKYDFMNLIFFPQLKIHERF